MTSFFVFLIIFTVVVFAHELGHLFVAKRSGILCREFAIGFGPKIFVFKLGETVYTIRMLPIGGYVSMAGENTETEDIKPGQTVGVRATKNNVINHIFTDNYSSLNNIRVGTVVEIDLEHKLSLTFQDEHSDEIIEFKCSRNAIIHSNNQDKIIAPSDRRFNNKPLKDRFLTILAGPLMNFALAFLLFCIGYLSYGTPTNQLDKIMENSPASKSSLQEGDFIIEINGEYMDDWYEIQNYIYKHPGKQLNMVAQRNDNTIPISVTIGSRTEKIGNQMIKRGYLGITPLQNKSLINSIAEAFQQTGNYTFLILGSLKDLVMGQLSLDSLSGPIGIYKVTDSVTDLGVHSIITFAGFISINLGIFNLLPIPSLDGGRLTFLMAEYVRGRKVNSKIEDVFHFVGFLLLLLLIMIITYNDIVKLSF